MTPAERRELEIAFRGAPAEIADRRKVRVCALCGQPFWSTSKEIRDPECQHTLDAAKRRFLYIPRWRKEQTPEERERRRQERRRKDDELEARLCAAFAEFDRDERWRRNAA